MKRVGFFVAVALFVGCGGRTAAPRPQWRVTVSTDAPLPQFGDRLLVEVLDENGAPACHTSGVSVPGAVGCRRVFGIAEGTRWPISFGIAASGAQAVFVRLRLYRTMYTGSEGLPAGSALVDFVGRLPAAHEVTPAYAELPMRCFGVASQFDKKLACDPSTGKLAPVPVLGAPPAKMPQPGSWKHAGDVPCPAATPKDMVCIAGGTFLLGSYGSLEPLQGLAATPERLVMLSPFALDVDEVTVGQVKQLVAQGAISQTPTPRDPSVGTLNNACTYYLGADDPTQDKRPVNCVSQTLAADICQALGKRLPTEAEWEFAASNRNLETTYPWGESTDICARATVGLGRTGVQFAGVAVSEDPSCRLQHPGLSVVGPLAGGSADDRTLDGVKNLGGNVSEWVRDALAPYDAPCWQPDRQLLVDPTCTQAPAGALQGPNVRGGSWAGMRLMTQSFMRSSMQSSPYAGFRCAKSF